MRALVNCISPWVSKLSLKGLQLPTTGYTRRILSKLIGSHLPFTHPVNKLFSVCWFTETTLGIGHEIVNETSKNLCHREAYILAREEQVNTKINKINNVLLEDKYLGEKNKAGKRNSQCHRSCGLRFLNGMVWEGFVMKATSNKVWKLWVRTHVRTCRARAIQLTAHESHRDTEVKHVHWSRSTRQPGEGN